MKFNMKPLLLLLPVLAAVACSDFNESPGMEVCQLKSITLPDRNLEFVYDDMDRLISIQHNRNNGEQSFKTFIEWSEDGIVAIGHSNDGRGGYSVEYGNDHLVKSLTMEYPSSLGLVNEVYEFSYESDKLLQMQRNYSSGGKLSKDDFRFEYIRGNITEVSLSENQGTDFHTEYALFQSSFDSEPNLFQPLIHALGDQPGLAYFLVKYYFGVRSPEMVLSTNNPGNEGENGSVFTFFNYDYDNHEHVTEVEAILGGATPVSWNITYDAMCFK